MSDKLTPEQRREIAQHVWDRCGPELMEIGAKRVKVESEVERLKRINRKLYNACREARAAIKQHQEIMQEGFRLQVVIPHMILPSVLTELNEAIQAAEEEK